MAGTSRRELSDFYTGELSGVIASQWGEDVMVTCDDKLHLSEQTTVQTVQGPINFTKSGSMHTFASPVNFSSTIITPLSNNLASLTTDEVTQLLNIGTAAITAGEWSQIANIGAASITAGEWSQIANIGAAAISGTEWGYVAAMNQNVNSASTVAFAGVTLVNTVNEFSTDTTLAGNSDTAVPSERAVKTYADLRALWNANNSGVARHYSIGPFELVNLARQEDGVHDWTYDNSNHYAMSTGQVGGFSHLGVHLPHGAEITAIRVWCQKTDTANLYVSLIRGEQDDGIYDSPKMLTATATTSMEEIVDSDPESGQEIVDNSLYFYNIFVDHSNGAGNMRIRSIQIDYTVVRPQP